MKTKRDKELQEVIDEQYSKQIDCSDIEKAKESLRKNLSIEDITK